MLSPERLDEAGELVARVYRGIEAGMLAYLAELMLSGDGITSKGIAAAALLGQTRSADLRAIIDGASETVSDEVRTAVESLLRESDRDDMERLGIGVASSWPRQVESTVAGIAEILERDNVAMHRGALDAYNRACVEAITKVNSGAETAERALHQAVRRMHREGIKVVQYRDESGRETVANHVDVAVRRHVRTQIAQAGGRMTAASMDRHGVQLVEVSSHPNARPSHAAWQGRVYGWNGPVTIDGHAYDGFVESTGYGSVDGLLGANCRHSFGPYLHGAPRAYEPDPKHASGLPGEQVYELEQQQRALERRIREAKRELAGATIAHADSPSLASQAQVAAAKRKVSKRQAQMRALIERSNSMSVTGAPVLHRNPPREWAGDMPKAPAIPKPSDRTMREFLGGASAKRAIRSAGMTQEAARRALSEQLSLHGMKAHDFKGLNGSSQHAMLDKGLKSDHAIDRMNERGVTQRQIDDALSNPLHITPIKIDEHGRPSRKHIGREATAVVNPDTGVIVTTYRTKSRLRRKYERELRENGRQTDGPADEPRPSD